MLERNLKFHVSSVCILFTLSTLRLAAALSIQFMNQKSREILSYYIIANPGLFDGMLRYENISQYYKYVLVQQKYLSSYLKTWNKKTTYHKCIQIRMPDQTKSTTDVSKNNLSASFSLFGIQLTHNRHLNQSFFASEKTYVKRFKSFNLLRIALKASTWWRFNWFPRSLAPSPFMLFLLSCQIVAEVLLLPWLFSRVFAYCKFIFL